MAQKRNVEMPMPSPEHIRRREAEEAAIREDARERRREYLDTLDPRQRAVLSWPDDH